MDLIDLKVYDFNKNEVGSISVPQKIFKAESNTSVIYEAVKNQLANKRQGTSSSLTRGEVNGTTRKPFKQKGTGRARAGSFKSPLWKGKGIIFGPKPRDYSYSVPKKVRRSALFSIISDFNSNGSLTIIDDFKLDKYSTKTLYGYLKPLISSEMSSKKALLIIDPSSEGYTFVRKSANNLAWIKCINVNAMELKDLFFMRKKF